MSAQGDQKSSKTNCCWIKKIPTHCWSLGALGRVLASRPPSLACTTWRRPWGTSLTWGEIKIKTIHGATIWAYNHRYQHNNTSTRIKPSPSSECSEWSKIMQNQLFMDKRNSTHCWSLEALGRVSAPRPFPQHSQPGSDHEEQASLEEK
jgi:hypothetical protein